MGPRRVTRCIEAAARRLHFGAAALTIVCIAVAAADDKPAPTGKPQWRDQVEVALPKAELPGLEVTLSEPVLVARSQGFLWFPTIARLANGSLLVKMQDYADVHVQTSTSVVAWSGDGGLTWTSPVAAFGGDVVLPMASGDTLVLPYYLRPVSDGVMGNSYQVNPKGKQTLETRPGLTVSGLPRRDRSFAPAELRLCGFVFNGSTVELRSVSHLATLYGYFEGDTRYSLVAVESSDGVTWKFRSVVAASDSLLPGADGPSESATVRLKSGRLMCVFRLGSGVPLGQCFSDDDGRTWTKPVAMQGPFSVQPGLVRMTDGTLALSSGRPGCYVWLNPAGDGLAWHRVDVLAAHNAALPGEKVEQSSCYTEIVALDDTHLLVAYDRIPFGWNAVPAGSKETNSCWVVRLTVRRAVR